jgi:hypothetical protein
MTTMLSKIAAILQPVRLASVVTQGQLYCVNSGHDVEVDRCYACPSFEGTYLGPSGETRLRCRVLRTGRP